MKKIPELSFEDILFLPTKIRFPAALIIYLIITIFFSNFFDFFGSGQLQQLTQKILPMSDEIIKMRAAMTHFNMIKNQQHSGTQNLLMQKLGSRNLSYIFNQLTLLAQQSNTEIDAIKPLEAQKTYGLITQPIVITLSTSYEGFLQFLHNLKHLPIIFTISELRIQPNNHTKQEANNLNFNMNIDIYTNESHD